MGSRLVERIRGTPTEVGAAVLTLDGDDWTITEGDRKIAHSDTVTPEAAESELSPKFQDQHLQSVSFSRHKKELNVWFSGGLKITSKAQADDHSLCIFTLPDGLILGCDPNHGFDSDQSISEIRAQRFATISDHR
jgi:hypothetical protein